MKIYKINLYHIEKSAVEECISNIKGAAVQNGFTFEKKEDTKHTSFFMGNIINQNHALLNKISSLPYLKVAYDSDKKIIGIWLCYNSLTIIGLIFTTLLLSITFYSGLITLKIKNIFIPLVLTIITIHSFYKRLLPYLRFKNHVYDTYSSKLKY